MEGAKTNSDSLLLTLWQQHLRGCCWNNMGGGALIWQHSSVWEKADHMGYMLRPVFCHNPAAMDNYILNRIKDFWTGVNIISFSSNIL